MKDKLIINEVSVKIMNKLTEYLITPVGEATGVISIMLV
jgi:hypothetical protein